MIKEAISTLVAGEDLTPETMKQVMEEIMTGEATDAQKASFLTALAIKGETIEEITEAAKVMRSHCAPFDNDIDTLDTAQSGGWEPQREISGTSPGVWLPSQRPPSQRFCPRLLRVPAGYFLHTAHGQWRFSGVPAG